MIIAISRYTLKDLRKIKRLSVEKLAEKTGIPLNTLKMLEIDSGEITHNALSTLSHFYDIGIDYIYIGKESDFCKRGNE